MPSRLLRSASVLALTGGALLLGGPVDASVGVDQSYPVPASRVLTLHGHGWGHGHGMSQYGAWGAARQGLTYRQIVGFYYPGTSWSTETGRVRVLVTSDTTTDVQISPAAGLTVRDLGAGRTYQLPTIAGARRWKLDVDAAGRSVVSYLTSAGWQDYAPAGQATLVGDGEFRAAGPLTLWTPSGSRTFRGALRAASPTPGSVQRDTVNVVSVERYVQGVLPSEMPTSWSMEALKAQAVAARTYATWSRDLFPDRYYQICDTSSCQVYRGQSGESDRGNQAVAATAQQILTYGGVPAFTQFASSSGGWLSAGSRPYLAAKQDPYDGAAPNPVHDWTVSLAASRVQDAYPGIGRLTRLHVLRREGGGQWGGRVVSVVLDGSKKDVTVSGDTFRSRFGLRSSWFAG